MEADGELLTAAEAAAFVGCNERTVRKWAEAGRIESVEAGGRIHYRRADLAPYAKGRGEVEHLKDEIAWLRDLVARQQQIIERLALGRRLPPGATE
jgi:excisionase family DNA binding protein